MDERKIKRLVVLLAMALIVIFVAKFMLTKTLSRLNQAAAEKKSAVVVQPASVVAAPDDVAAASAVEEASEPVSAVSIAP